MNKTKKQEFIDALDNIYLLVEAVQQSNHISQADNRILETINSEVREIFDNHNFRGIPTFPLDS